MKTLHHSLIAAIVVLFGLSVWPSPAFPNPAPPAQSANDTLTDQKALSDFDWTTAHIATNYAGWEIKTVGNKGPELTALIARLRADILARGRSALTPALREFIAWFDDGHLQITPITSDVDNKPWPRLTRPIDRRTAESKLASSNTGRKDIEGVWTIDDAYRLAVIERPGQPNVFDALILETSAPQWRPNEVKAVLTRRANGQYDVRYGTAERFEVAFGAILKDQNATIETEGFGLWRRVFDNQISARAAIRLRPSDMFGMERINDQTLLLRLPSFDLSHRQTIVDLMAAHQVEIANTDNLIVDVRHNGRGGDASWIAAFAPIYTRPVYRIGVQARATPANIAALESIRTLVQTAAPELAGMLEAQIDRMKQGSGYVSGEPYPFAILRFGAIMPKPSRVVVLVDDAASAAENFILAARQSRKVILMGQKNSAGVLDFGDVVGANLPSGRYRLTWPTTRSLRLPLDPVDPSGITPDVIIPSDVQDPIAWVERWLAQAKP